MVKIGAVETALRARDIVAHSFPTDRKNARWVAPASYDRTRNGFKITTITKESGKRSRTHRVAVAMPAGYRGSFNSCPEVRIDCDCGRHQFVWCFALLKRDAAIRDRTNGEPPVITNPTEEPGCCKHALVALRLLQRTNPQWSPRPPSGGAGGSRPIPLTGLDQELKRLRRAAT